MVESIHPSYKLLVKLLFVLRLPFSQAWEQELGDEGTSAVISQLEASIKL
jgi:hypothetical protein